MSRPSGEPRIFTRYVAIGDSFTEGMSDADPERANRYVGWADRLAVPAYHRRTNAGGDVVVARGDVGSERA